jgi:hypothetical protein
MILRTQSANLNIQVEPANSKFSLQKHSSVYVDLFGGLTVNCHLGVISGDSSEGFLANI